MSAVSDPIEQSNNARLLSIDEPIERSTTTNINATSTEIENNDNTIVVNDENRIRNNTHITLPTVNEETVRNIDGTIETITQQEVEEPYWHDDKLFNECQECGIKFSFFIRRHHCRKCGKIYCNKCCGKYCKYIPGSYVIEESGNEGKKLVSGMYKYLEFRTCDSCYEEIRMLKEALGIIEERDENREDHNETDDSDDGEGDRDDIDETNSNVDTINGIKHSEPREITMEISESRAGTESIELGKVECPICGIDIGEKPESERERHISQCLTEHEFGSPNTNKGGGGTEGGIAGRRDKNRMIVYKLEDKDNKLDSKDIEECVICLEDIEPGDVVGRLECLCCFHYKCIKDWINRKGVCECPVHSLI